MPAVPTSPPKRMTRARAKAVEDQTAPKPTRIVTASSRAAHSTKRKTREDDDEGVGSASTVSDNNAMPQMTRAKPARGRPKKATVNLADTAGVGITDSKPEEVVAAAPKATRGRPRKTAIVTSSAKSETATDIAGPGHQATRARMAPSVKTAAASKAQIPKKKVTFQDPSEEKENVFFPTDQSRTKVGADKIKPTSKPTGFRAAPVRRPPGRKASRQAPATSVEQKEIEGIKLPLSPKKDTQVAKADTQASECDELSGPKTPTKALCKSPLKVPASILRKTPLKPPTASITELLATHGNSGPTSNEAYNHTVSIASSTEAHGMQILDSPAKRPAPSPFKNSLKVSPIKVPGIVQPSAHTVATPATMSKLQRSPKRFALERLQRHSALKPPSTSLKASILQSPARRPPSPTKHMAPRSPGKGRAGTSATVASKYASPSTSPGAIVVSPGKMFTSSLRAARSPEQSTKVHTVTPAEKLEMFTQELTSESLEDISFHRANTMSIEEPHPIRNPQMMHDTWTKGPNTSPLPLRSTPTSPVKLVDEEASSGSPEMQADPTATAFRSGSTSPPLPPTQSLIPVFKPRSPTANIYSEEDSEDELHSDNQNYTPTPFRRAMVTTKDYDTPGNRVATHAGKTPSSQKAIDALTEQLQNWKGATPQLHTMEQRKASSEPVFSPIKPCEIKDTALQSIANTRGAPTNTFFEDQTIIDTNHEILFVDEDPLDYGGPPEHVFSLSMSQLSEASQDYGNENEIPIDPALLEISRMPPQPLERVPRNTNHPASSAAIPPTTCTPAKVFSLQPRVIHTVSKVPLKPPAEESPSRKPLKRRSHSVSGPLSPRAEFQHEATREGFVPLQAPSTPRLAATKASKFSEIFTPSIAPPFLLETPKLDAWSIAGSPARTPRADLDGSLLSGAVVYVDVHTTEGADASGIFVELLTQMGARCVKQWNWNPRPSIGGPDPTAICNRESMVSGKVGITHVVFKDGGKRTMEKVRESKGVVACVGVGWVLDCERENRWVDEAEYAIDVSTIPRGGHRRRKSMEPRAISNLNGNFMPGDSATRPAAEISPTKEFLNLSSPTNRRESFTLCTAAEWRISLSNHPPPPAPEVPSTLSHLDDETETPLQTPTAVAHVEDIYTYATPDGESSWGSPTTPYFLKPDQLVQQTCPPKQGHPLLFPITGRIEDQPDEGIRQRLLLARRKSLQWAPKVGSPLARGFSYGL